MKIFYSFLIVFLFSLTSTAQNDNEVIFDYPDYLCPDLEDVVINTDNNGQVDLSDFLKNAKECLDQSDYEAKGFIEWEIENGLKEALCDDYVPSCLEKLEASIAEVQINLLKYQQARILYPDGYQKVGELNEYNIKGANLALQSEESCSCSDLSLARMLIYGSEAQHNRVMNRLKSLGTSCLRAMFNALVNSEDNVNWIPSPLQTFNIPSSCQDQRDQPVCRRLNSDAEVIQQRLSSLVYSISAKILDSSDLNSGNQSFNSLDGGISSDFLSELDNYLLCSDYVIGEERQLGGLNPEKGEKYLIKRESKNHYTASIAIRFTSFGFDNSTSQEPDLVYDHHIHTHYMQKAQECIKEANTKMLGPNGEKLEIVLKNANEVSSCEYQHDILIVTPPSVYGASYTSYPSDIDNCAFITHEILHVFGLSDEYDKNVDIKPIPYPIADSHNPLEDQILLYKISGIPENNSSDEEYESCGETPVQYNSIMANVLDRWDNVFEFGKDQSLLDPTHFKAILYGNCTDREDVQLYNQCYDITFSSDDEENYCSIRRDIVAECRKANVLGRTKQRELDILEHELSTDQESYRRKINWTKERMSLPVIVEESTYDSTKQHLLERLEAVRGWRD